MPPIDERLRTELSRAARLGDAAGVLERVSTRRSKRARARRLRAGGLAIAVAVVTGTWVVVATSPPDDDRGLALGRGAHGSAGIVVVCSDAFGTHLCRIDRRALERGVEERDLVRLTSRELEVVSMPAVSPGGTTVVFDRHDPVSGTTSLWTVRVDGSDLRPLSAPESGLTNASWAPDGSLVAVASAGTPGGPPAALAILDPTLAPDPVVRTIPLEGLVFPSTPRFSPDGDLILFTAGEDATSAATHLYTVRRDGSRLTRRTEATAWTPDWSPDGERIVFGRATPDGEELFACPLDCADPRRIEDASGAPIRGGLPRWSPDGASIAFQVVNPNGDAAIHLVRPDDGATSVLVTEVGEQAWIPRDTSDVADVPAGFGRDLGLGFNLCRFQVHPGLDLVGSGQEDRAWTGDRVIPDAGCPTAAGHGYLAVALLGERLPTYLAGPLRCAPRCALVATPDVDGDGSQELVLGFDLHVPTAPGRGWLYDLRIGEAGSGLFRIERDDGRPLVVTWGSGGAGSWAAGTTCPRPGVLQVWRATSPDAGRTWVVRTIRYRISEGSQGPIALEISRSTGSRVPEPDICGIEPSG